MDLPVPTVSLGAAWARLGGAVALAYRKVGRVFARAWPLRRPTPIAPPDPDPAPEPPREHVEPAAGSKAKPAPGQQDRGKDVEEAGRWYFRRDVLDRLDVYFRCVRRMKRADPAAYRLYTRVGAVLINPRQHGTDVDLAALASPAFRRIGFGAVACPFLDEAKQHQDKIYPVFLYFQKLKRAPARVQAVPEGVDVYEVDAFYVDHEKPGGLSFPLAWHVAVDPQGNIQTLKELTVHVQTVRCRERSSRHKAQARARNDVLHLRRSAWGYPQAVTMTAREKGWTIERSAVNHATLFASFYLWHREALNDVRVSCKKNGSVAVFSVDLLRTPYFFSDREPVVVDGVTKKIFHIVRTHRRVYASGREDSVRSHFRGLRTFTWHGYEVRITMPGKHHADPLAFDVAAMPGEHAEGPRAEWRGSGWLGKTMQEHLEV